MVTVLRDKFAILSLGIIGFTFNLQFFIIFFTANFILCGNIQVFNKLKFYALYF